MIKASELRVWGANGELLTGSARDAKLAEYRATGGMVDAWFADTSNASTPEDWDALSNEGPAVDEIDWS